MRDQSIIGAGFGGIGGRDRAARPRLHDVVILERGAGARRHLALQRLSGRGLRRPEPPLLVLVRAAARLVAAVLPRATRSSATCSGSRASTTSTGSWCRDTEVDALRVDDGRLDGRRAADGRTFDADAVIVATGQLHRAALRRACPGRETFAGHSFHSAEWDHDYDLRGKRVAVDRHRRERRAVRARDGRAGRASSSSSSARATGSCRAEPRLPALVQDARSGASPACRPSGAGSSSGTASR